MSDVHFDFTVSAVDAENIMQLMRAGVAKQNEYILKCMLNGDSDEERWHRLHKKYLEELIGKMTNFHVQ